MPQAARQRLLETAEPTAKLDLTCTLTEREGGLAGTLEIAVGRATPVQLLAGAADRALRGSAR